MSKLFSLTALLLYISAPSTNAAAIPVPAAEKVSPEVIPGPGLPSLASLGLTSAELYQTSPTLNSKLDRRNKLFEPYCGGGHGATSDINDVMACYRYLLTIGKRECRIPGDRNQHTMCSAGTANINGIAATNHDTASICSDVALGVQYVFTHCNTNGQVEGDAAANGNGDLIVVVGSR